MKKIILVLVSTLAVMSCATTIAVTDSNKTVNNFTYNNGNVTWSEVFYMKPAEADDVKDWFRDNFIIRNERGNSLTGETTQAPLPMKEAGLSWGSTTIILQKPCTVYFTTDFKEDRYRVTVNRIIWEPQMSAISYGIASSVGPMSLNEIATTKNGYNSTFYNQTSEQLYLMLEYLFTPKLEARTNDDW